MTTPRRKLTVKKDAFSAVVARLCDCHASTPYQVENMGRGIFHLSPGPIAAGVHSWESYREISREAWALFDRKLDLIYTDEVAYYVWLQEVFADGDGGERDHVLRQVRTIHERFMLSGPTLCKISLLFCSKLDRMLGDLVDPADFGRESVSCSPSIMLDVVASRMVGDMLVLVADAAPLDKAFMFADFCASPIVMMEAMHKCDAFEAAWRADARAHLRKALTAQAHANTRRRDADAAAAALIAEEEESNKENADPHPHGKKKAAKANRSKKAKAPPLADAKKTAADSRQALAEEVEGRAELARRARERESEAARRRMLKEMTADAAMVSEAIREIESVILEDLVDTARCGACGEDLRASRSTCWPCGHDTMCDTCALAAWTTGGGSSAACPRCSDPLACVTLSGGRRIGF